MKKQLVIIFVLAIAIPALLALRQHSNKVRTEEDSNVKIFSSWTRQDALLTHLQQIRGLPTSAAKNDSLRAIVNAATSKSIAKDDASVRSKIVRDYLFWIVVPIAEALKENGASEVELSDFLLKAWDSFAALANSFDCLDCPQGYRLMAKTAKRDYEDGSMLFDTTIIPLLFQGMPDGAASRFRQSWRDMAKVDAGVPAENKQ